MEDNIDPLTEQLFVHHGKIISIINVRCVFFVSFSESYAEQDLNWPKSSNTVSLNQLLVQVGSISNFLQAHM